MDEGRLKAVKKGQKLHRKFAYAMNDTIRNRQVKCIMWLFSTTFLLTLFCKIFLLDIVSEFSFYETLKYGFIALQCLLHVRKGYNKQKHLKEIEKEEREGGGEADR